ncbi:hypothetical protein RHMOL_Rhmol12G0145100 [Rhododendron molle]|uniref:Uncharacterized protein n=1 Tax=Rhododendron molle TaxID=49168 RepID=A0ACC0LIC2_RHOML|nr:hypothetical protein RHMOL_Rhmol12G0145100 [Rhododendron molle]
MVVDGKVKDGCFVVEKRSSDPYDDFTTSLLEMIVEKQIFGARNLEDLLETFLSKNSHHHHRVVVEWAEYQRLEPTCPPTMLSLGGSPPSPPSLSNTTPLEILSPSLPFPTKTHQTHLSFLSNGLTHHAFRPVLSTLRTNFCVSSLKSRRKGSHTRSAINSSDGEEEVEDEIEEEEEDEDEEDDEFIPLRSMKEWYANKPRGFGEGKVYDTSLEEKLAAEIERSRRAQLANINKLKSSPGSTSKSSEGVLLKQKAPKDVPNGIRVRLVNLPKKKNVQRDLQLAFKGVRGIVDVIPAVSGNKKTRDPICKGYAFVDLKTEEDANSYGDSSKHCYASVASLHAHPDSCQLKCIEAQQTALLDRFVKSFSRQSITFGKIQKQVRCEIMNPKSPRAELKRLPDVNDRAPHVAIPSITFGKVEKQEKSEKMNPKSPSSVLKLPSDVNYCAPHLAISSLGESPVAKFDRISDASSDSCELIGPDDSEDEDDDHVPAQREEVSENLESLSLSKHSDRDSLGTRTETVAVSMPSKHKGKTLENGKKLKAKRKRTNVPKFKLPGSTNRLRVKEKAVLTGVFSKYAALAASASKGKP